MEENKKQTGLQALVSKVINLGELVQYQDGAIVSKEIIKKDIGTVTLFAFDEGQGLSEHTAPYDAMIIILDGAAEITISKEPYHLHKDDMIIMPANKPHSVKAEQRFKMLLVMIRG